MSEEKWNNLVDEMKHLGSGYGEPEADIILWADAELTRLREAVEWAIKVIEEVASSMTDKPEVYRDSKAAWIELASALRRRAALPVK